MKKIRLPGLIILVFCILSFSTTTANATTYTFQPSPADLWELTHQYAFTWGIDVSSTIPDDEFIVDASLFINNINNWVNESGNDRLFVHLLDDPSVGTNAIWDGDYPLDIATPSDYFSGQGIPLFEYSDTNGAAPYDLTHNFTAAQVDTLNLYAANDIFGFGFDPDCHYYNNGITFTIKTSVIPEPATLSLLGLGLVGLLGLRRRLAI